MGFFGFLAVLRGHRAGTRAVLVVGQDVAQSGHTNSDLLSGKVEQGPHAVLVWIRALRCRGGSGSSRPTYHASSPPSRSPASAPKRDQRSRSRTRPSGAAHRHGRLGLAVAGCVLRGRRLDHLNHRGATRTCVWSTGVRTITLSLNLDAAAAVVVAAGQHCSAWVLRQLPSPEVWK